MGKLYIRRKIRLGDEVLDERALLDRADLIRAGGRLVTVVAPTDVRPADGLTVDFVVEPDRAQLSEIVQRVRDGRLRTNIGKVASLGDAVATFNSTERRSGKTVIRVHP